MKYLNLILIFVLASSTAFALVPSHTANEIEGGTISGVVGISPSGVSCVNSAGVTSGCKPVAYIGGFIYGIQGTKPIYTNESFVAGTDVQVQGQVNAYGVGKAYGGYFLNSNSYIYAAFGGYGILGYGDTAGAYFADKQGTSAVYLAEGGYGVDATGANHRFCVGNSCMTTTWEYGNFGVDDYPAWSGCNYWAAGAGQVNCDGNDSAVFTCPVYFKTSIYSAAPNYGQCVDIALNPSGSCPCGGRTDCTVYARQYRWVTCYKEKRVVWNPGNGVIEW